MLDQSNKDRSLMRKYAPEDTVLAGVEKETREGKARRDRTKSDVPLGHRPSPGLFDDCTPKPAALPRSRLLNPSAPPCDQMDHDQHYSDHEQNPGNLHRDR